MDDASLVIDLGTRLTSTGGATDTLLLDGPGPVAHDYLVRSRRQCFLRQCFDRFIVAFVLRRVSAIMLPERLPQEAAHHVARLRCPVLSWVVISTVGLVTQAVCICRLQFVLLADIRRDCGPLQHWMYHHRLVLPIISLFLSLLMLLLPLCSAVSTFIFPPIALVYGIVVWVYWPDFHRLIASEVPESCQAMASDLQHIADELLGMTVASAICVFICLMLGNFIWTRIEQIRTFWQPSERMHEEVIRRVFAGPPLETVGSDVQCPICLEGSASSDERWRQLICQHIYHEHCLEEWLQRSRRCPLCRHDLQSAYLQTEPGIELPSVG